MQVGGRTLAIISIVIVAVIVIVTVTVIIIPAIATMNMSLTGRVSWFVHACCRPLAYKNVCIVYRLV